MSEDSARAKVEIRASTGRVLVLYMSKPGDSWLVDKFDYTWSKAGPKPRLDHPTAGGVLRGAETPWWP